MDDIPTYKQGDGTKYQFSGKRIHRGLYKSGNGTVMNADINWASNILRKEYMHAFDNVKDFTYLYETTIAIGYKDLYNNAKTMSERLMDIVTIKQDLEVRSAISIENEVA